MNTVECESARELLERQRDRYAQVVAASSEAMALVDERYVYLEANPSYQRLVGCQGSLTGRTVEEVLGAEVFQGSVKAKMDRCLAGEELSFEMERSGPDGSRDFLEANYTPCRDRDGATSAVAVRIRDVTERKRADDAIRDSEAQYRVFIEGLPDVVMRFDREGRHLFVSANVREVVPIEAPVFIGKTHRELGFPEALCRAWEERIREAFEKEVLVESEFEVDGKNGAAVFNWRLVPERDRAGRVKSVLSIARDITALRRSERDFQTLFQQMFNGFAVHELVFDASGHPVDYRFLAVNPAFERITGLKAEAITGKTVREVLPDTEPEWIERYARVALTGEPISFEAQAKGLGKWFEVHAFRPGPGQFACIIADVTERKRADAERRQLEVTLAQSDRLASMGMLAAGVAHEINNPLSYVLYNLESLAEDVARLPALAGAATADIEERLRDAVAGSRRIKEIARGLGTFARVESDELAPVDIRYAMEAALNIAFNEIKYRARIVKDLSPTAPVLGSEGRLSQVFLNLLVNAAHSIPEGDVEHNKIELRTWQDGRLVFAEVADTGGGIPAASLERIFEPFFTSKAVGKGSGLGLSITRNIVTAFGGTITVESEVGVGSRFRVCLPAARTTGNNMVETAEPREEPRAAGRILVIDDEAGIRRALQRILRVHVVVEADSGERARAIIEQDQDFDVILCDLMMPRVSGMDLHRWLLAHHPGLAAKVVFITGGTFTPGARAYVEEVDNLRLDKPFDPKNLQKLVAGWVSASRASGRT